MQQSSECHPLRHADGNLLLSQGITNIYTARKPVLITESQQDFYFTISEHKWSLFTYTCLKAWPYFNRKIVLQVYKCIKYVAVKLKLWRLHAHFYDCLHLGNWFLWNLINSCIFKCIMLIRSRTSDICVQFFCFVFCLSTTSLGMLLNMHLLVYANKIYRFKFIYLFISRNAAFSLWMNSVFNLSCVYLKRKCCTFTIPGKGLDTLAWIYVSHYLKDLMI